MILDAALARKPAKPTSILMIGSLANRPGSKPVCLAIPWLAELQIATLDHTARRFTDTVITLALKGGNADCPAPTLLTGGWTGRSSELGFGCPLHAAALALDDRSGRSARDHYRGPTSNAWRRRWSGPRPGQRDGPVTPGEWICNK